MHGNSFLFQLVAVSLGGGLGAGMRFSLSALFIRLWGPSMGFAATVVINVSGCFLLGMGMGLLGRASYSQLTSLFFTVGILGGFTTFSTFGLQSVTLFENSSLAHAIAYVSLSVFGGIIAAFLGMHLTRA